MKNTRHPGLLQPLITHTCLKDLGNSHPWTSLRASLVQPPPCIMLAVDKLSKHAHSMAIGHRYTAL
jgi:hypothetical protein